MNLLTDAKNNRPPRDSLTDPEDAILSTATAVVATSADIWAAYTSVDGTVGAPKGKVWLEVEAVTNDVYIRFTRTATTGTTSSNGALLKVGLPRVWYVDPNNRDKFIDHLSPGGIGILKYRVISSIGDRARQ